MSQQRVAAVEYRFSRYRYLVALVRRLEGLLNRHPHRRIRRHSVEAIPEKQLSPRRQI